MTDFSCGIRFQVEDIQHPRRLEVTDNADDTIPGYISFTLRRGKLPYRRRFWMKTEDAKALGEYLREVTDG